MGSNGYGNAINAELNDLRREREILAEEALSGKNAFASEIKDVLGQQILEELKKKPSELPPIKVEKPSKFKTFINKLFSIFQ